MDTIRPTAEPDPVAPGAGDLAASVVIVTHNGMAYLPQLKRALDLQTVAPQVIVFDNASNDGTPEWINRHWSEAALHRSDENLLFARGNNEAVKHATGDVVLFLNQDTEPSPNVVAEAIRYTSPTTAVTLAQQLPFTSEPRVPYLDWSGVLLWRVPAKDVEETNVVSGAAFALHRQTLAALRDEPFDPRIRHYCEDTNLALVLDRIGVSVLADSRAVVVHDSQPTTGSRLHDFRRAIQISRNRLLAFAYALGWPRTLSLLPRLLAAGVRKADIDNQRTVPRVIGLSLATILGYCLAGLSHLRARRSNRVSHRTRLLRR